MSRAVLAIDQGTTGSTALVFSQAGEILGRAYAQLPQHYPQPGWVEHRPLEIWERSQEVVREATAKAEAKPGDIAAVGITNQRETAVVWDKKTGKPLCNAIVWQCTRTDEICNALEKEGGQDRFRKKTGLPIATYFSGPKVKWILDNVSGARAAADKGRALFGTIETWIIWQLTGGTAGGAHVTDVSNASRTLLMDLDTLTWDDEILSIMKIPRHMLPRIVPSIDKDTWGHTLKEGPLGASVPVCGALGDQQAALVGQTCFEVGEAKNTYGTGCFMLLNTGTEPVQSTHGLLTTVGYQISGQKPVYCLEGSVAIAGALVQWLRDNLGLISSAPEVEDLARTVEDNGGVYIVPAFSGLFAPYWRSDARGVIAGLTRYVNKGHIARAVLEANAYQTLDIMEAMKKDSGVDLNSLKVDGGMVANELLMQFQADLLGTTVERPVVAETTALGAALLAALGVGAHQSTEDLDQLWRLDRVFETRIDPELRNALMAGWRDAVDRIKSH